MVVKSISQKWYVWSLDRLCIQGMWTRMSKHVKSSVFIVSYSFHDGDDDDDDDNDDDDDDGGGDDDDDSNDDKGGGGDDDDDGGDGGDDDDERKVEAHTNHTAYCIEITTHSGIFCKNIFSFLKIQHSGLKPVHIHIF